MADTAALSVAVAAISLSADKPFRRVAIEGKGHGVVAEREARTQPYAVSRIDSLRLADPLFSGAMPDPGRRVRAVIDARHRCALHGFRTHPPPLPPLRSVAWSCALDSADSTCTTLRCDRRCATRVRGATSAILLLPRCAPCVVRSSCARTVTRRRAGRYGAGTPSTSASSSRPSRLPCGRGTRTTCDLCCGQSNAARCMCAVVFTGAALMCAARLSQILWHPGAWRLASAALTSARRRSAATVRTPLLQHGDAAP